MSRETYVFRNGELVPKHQAEPLNSAPYIISDAIDPTWHPSDGKVYDSKSTFRRVTKSHGGVEVGNERQATRQTWQPVSRDDVHRAIQKVEQGYRPSLSSESLD